MIYILFEIFFPKAAIGFPYIQNPFFLFLSISGSKARQGHGLGNPPRDMDLE